MSLCFEAIQTLYWQRRLDAVSASAPLTDFGFAFLQVLLFFPATSFVFYTDLALDATA